MKDSGIQWIGQIPSAWTVCRLKDVAILYTGNSIKDEEKQDYMDSVDAIPYIATKDVDGVLYDTNYDNGLYVKYDDTSFRTADAGCSLMCIEGGSAGKKKTLLTRKVAFVNKLCCFMPVNIDERFLFYYLCSPNFEDEFKKNLTGLIGGVSVSVLRTFKFVKPDKQQQQRIANYLDVKCHEIDEVIRNARSSIDEYRKLRISHITEVVTKGFYSPNEYKISNYDWIGEFPVAWKEIKIKWLLCERKERSETGIEEPLSMSQKYGLIPSKEMDTIPNMASSFIGAKVVHKGDLVFNKLKAHLGVFAVSQYDGLVSPDYAVYYSTGRANMNYLEYLFKTPQYICEFQKKSSGVGAGLTRLYTEDLFSIYCALPELDEQERLIDYLAKKIREIDDLIKKKEEAISEMELYKKSVIYECITGKREVS